MADWSKPVWVRFPQDEYEIIEAYKEERGISRSEAIRRLVDTGLRLPTDLAEQAEGHAAE